MNFKYAGSVKPFSWLLAATLLLSVGNTVLAEEPAAVESVVVESVKPVAKQPAVSDTKTEPMLRPAEEVLKPLEKKDKKAGYIIGAEDVLDIRVWENSSLSATVSVRPDGMVTVPLLGDVEAIGLEPLELKAILESRLSSFVKVPVVTVIVKEIFSNKVFVLGGGVQNKVETLRRKTTLMQFISQIGVSEGANFEGAFLIRDGKRLDVDFYGLAVKGDITEDIQLKSDDTVFIPDNFERRVQIVGAVNAPATITYKRGLTLLDAILQASGFNEFANPNKLLLIRKKLDDDGKEVTEAISVRFKDVVDKGDVSQNIVLEPGDMIIVKEGIL